MSAAQGDEHGSGHASQQLGSQNASAEHSADVAVVECAAVDGWAAVRAAASTDNARTRVMGYLL